jgi:hypothetical protein
MAEPAIDVEGLPLAPESLQMVEYLRRRSGELTPRAVAGRLAAAASELEDAIARAAPEQARLRAIPGKWNLAEIVDHIAQTQVRGAEELRHLLAGRRPPLPPVYEALRSGAAAWAPWETLVAGLHDANRSMVELLLQVPDDAPDGTVTVCTVMVALRKRDDGTAGPQIWFAELRWKEYALLQRLHLLDHRTQVRNLLARLLDAPGASI